MIGTDIFANMVTLLVVLFIANCITLSADPLMRSVTLSADPLLRSVSAFNFEILQPNRKQQVKGIHGFHELLLQRLWETSDVRNESGFFNFTGMNLASRSLNVQIEPHEQKLYNAEDTKTDDEFKKRYNKGFIRKRKVTRSKKEHDILMDDITYGIFGNCYNISLLSDQPFIMIDQCPLWARDINDVRLCHSSRPMEEFDECSIDMRLVPVSDGRGYIYKNIYCARCHGIQDVTTWEVELLYDSLSALRFSESERSLVFLGKLEGTPKCIPFVYPLKPKSKFLCNHHRKVKLHDHRHSYRDAVQSPSSKEYPLSFQILINFGINGKGHVFFSTSVMTPVVQHTCDDNEIYDPKIHECRRVVCKQGYVLIDKKCILKTQKYDTISDQRLNDATSRDYAIQIIYRFNVSRSDILQLKTPEACDEVIDAFATMLNISTSRIQHFQINIINGTLGEKTVEIHQTANAVDEHSFDRNHSSESCNGQIDDQPLADTSRTFKAEFSFSLLPSSRKNGSSIKTKLLHLKGSFNFVINGTKFQADNPGAHTPVQLDNWCTKGMKYQKFEHEFEFKARLDPQSGGNVTAVYVNSTGKFYPTGMYDLWFWATGNIGNISDVSTFVYVFVCDMPKIADKDCARFQIGSSNYTRLRNASILLEDKRIVDINAYEYVNENENCTDIQVCVPESYFIGPPSSSISFGCGENYKTVLITEGYLSFVLGIISVIVLAIVIVTYALFDKLRNLPGLNMMSLTLSLLLGELLFIISGSIEQNSDIMCPAVGASLHFLFLSSFFWMNVMSYDVFRTFANKCILTRIRRTKTYFPRYSLYAWGIPAGIVVVCCVLEYTRLFPNLKIGYGGSAGDYYSYYEENMAENLTSNNPMIVKLSKKKFGCWIQEPVAALIAFGLPMIGIVCANSIMFIRTIICIRSVTKLVSVRTRRSSGSAIGQHDVMLYVRMSTVMGFTWIFGLASSIVSSFSENPTSSVCISLHALGILFIIFNCSQGLFIFFVFVLNKRVGALYKQLFLQCRSKTSRQTSISSVTTTSSLSTITERT